MSKRSFILLAIQILYHTLNVRDQTIWIMRIESFVSSSSVIIENNNKTLPY